MLRYIKNSGLKNIVIFVHGFTGGVETWVREDGAKSILDYLLKDIEFSNSYDFAVFDYFTRITDFFKKISNSYNLVFDRQKSKDFNLTIDDIAKLLNSELRFQEIDYENVIIIAHSMGGLITKSLILDEILKYNKTSITAYYSLAVPHRGSNYSTFGRLFFNNPQIEDLNPLSNKINEMNELWIKKSDKLPKSMYIEGLHDKIVPPPSSVPFENRDNFDVVSSDDDHFTITCPKDENDIIIKAIKKSLKTILRENKQLNINAIQKEFSEIQKSFFTSTNERDLRYNLYRIENLEKYYDNFELKELKSKIIKAIEFELSRSRDTFNTERRERHNSDKYGPQFDVKHRKFSTLSYIIRITIWLTSIIGSIILMYKLLF